MNRRKFLKNGTLASAGLFLSQNIFAKNVYFESFPVVRTPIAKRHFTSPAIEDALTTFKKR